MILKKNFIFFICYFFLFFAAAQEDNLLLSADSLSLDTMEVDSSDLQNQVFIAVSKEIPAYDLYNQEWNNEHIRIRKTEIPFLNDTLQFLLVNDTSQFVYPLLSNKVCSPYGFRRNNMHTGIDIKASLNDSIVSCFDGVVRMAKVYSGYGKVVVIRHYNGLETVYAHLNRIVVKNGQKVSAGQFIGLAGRTGRATTEHLHFEVRFLYEHFNPTFMIDFEQKQLLSDTLILTPQKMKIKSNVTTTTANVPLNADYHIVKKGDTLYGISRKYGISLKQILQLNHIEETSILHIGQKIKLK